MTEEVSLSKSETYYILNPKSMVKQLSLLANVLFGNAKIIFISGDIHVHGDYVNNQMVEQQNNKIRQTSLKK